jgi:hypothetical protein
MKKSGKCHHRAFIQKGIRHGKRPELIGCGLIRSAGGWTTKKIQRQSKKPLKKIQLQVNPPEADSNRPEIATPAKKINLDNKTRFV